MDTQNTSIHLNLWHHDFWRLCVANLLLMTSVYMLTLGIPYFMMSEGYMAWQIGCVLGSYGVGIFLLGGFCSYLVQRYRRNRVCELAILCVVASMFVPYYLEVFCGVKPDFAELLAARLLLGAFLGLAQMTLGSTLVIDTCESFQRTEANHVTSWFSRLAVATGPLLALLVREHLGMRLIFPVAALVALVALVLVSLAKFPFKAPTDHMPLFCCDRFFLPRGLPLFANIVLIMMAVGVVFSVPLTASVFLMLLGGLVLGFVAEKVMFADADLKSEVITGLVLQGGSLFVMQSEQTFAQEVLMPLMLGVSVGIMGGRFLLFYIKLAKHCQRGTSVSSFFLAWELGISLGLGLGCVLVSNTDVTAANLDTPIYNMLGAQRIYVALGLTLVSLLLYNFFVHPWYMKHRNR